MHSTYFLYIYMAWTYGKGPFRQQERKPTATTILFSKQQEIFYMQHPTDRTAHSCGALAGMRNSSMGP